MKKNSTTLITLALLAASGLGRAAQPKGQRATVKGEAVDMWCYLEGGDRGPAKRECAIACAKAGNPIGIVDAKGNLFIAAGLEDHQPAHALLLGKMNSAVAVSGTLVKKGGVQMIYIDTVQ